MALDRQPKESYLPGWSGESGLLQQGKLFYYSYCLKLPRHQINKNKTDFELVLLLLHKFSTM